MRIRKTIRKDLRRDDGNVQVFGGVDAVISANVGEPGGETHVRSSQRIVQRSGRRVRAESEEPAAGEQDQLDRERASELPDREGTYDQLRDQANRKQAGDEPAKGGPDV
jgi:hypothetical protein